MLFSLVVSACQSFRPVAQFTYLVIVYFFRLFFPSKESGVAYRHAYNVPW